MTATDDLRRLLDERGVEWEDDSPVPSMKQWKTSFTSFTGEEVTLGCYEEPKWIMGTLVFHTPEQAIEATLGRGECRNVHEPPRNTTFWPTPHFKCSECGATHVSMDYVYFCPNCGRKVMA